MNQSAVANSECRTELQKCFERFLNGFYSLWRLIVDFFSNSKQKALELENAALRETLKSQKDVFTESLRRHEPLMQRIFTLEFDRESLRQENQRLVTRGNDVEKEAEFLRKVSKDTSQRATASLKSKDIDIRHMKEGLNLLEAEMESLKVAIGLLEDQKDEINGMYKRNEEEKQKLIATVSAQGSARLKETSKWKCVVEQKTIEKEAMDSEISLLRKGKEQLEVEREETRKELEELKDLVDDLRETSCQHFSAKEEQEKISLQLESQKDSLEIELANEARKFDEEISKRTGRIERQKNALTVLQEALAQAKRGSRGLVGAVKGLKQEKKDLKAALSRLEDKKSALETKLNERQQTIDLQRKNMKAWNACVAQNKALTDILGNGKDELSKAISQLQREKRGLQSRNEELKVAMNIAETRAVSAKAGLDTGCIFLQQLMEKHIEELKQFLSTDAQKRDDQRRKDLKGFKELMEENASLQKRNEEVERNSINWETRATVVEKFNEMKEIQLQNDEIENVAGDLGSGESEM